MRTFDFYEFAALLTPGAVLLIGLTVLFPSLAPTVNGKDVTFGNLGVFVVLAYAVGHVVQALGGIIENRLLWRLTAAGARPTDWIRRGTGYLLAPAQRETLKAQLQPKLGLAQPVDMGTIGKDDWDGLVRQVYAAVEGGGRTARVDIFNGTYGLCRGIATSLVMLLIALVASGVVYAYHHHTVIARGDAHGLVVGLALVGASVLVLHRMYSFGRYYARELFVQFLQLPLPEGSGSTGTSSDEKTKGATT